MADKETIAIVGGGIGGLTAGVALRQAGFEVEVHERAAELKPVGAGLTVQPNAVVALRRLGLGDKVESAGRALHAGSLWRHDGSMLIRITPEAAAEMDQEIGALMIGIHRATLHEILFDAVGKERVHLGRTCTGYEQDESSVRVRFSDGSEVKCAALVAADGIRSTVRAQLLADGDPIYAGYAAWRGLTPHRCGLPDDWGGEGWGPISRFGGCCVDGGLLYWFAVADAPPGIKETPAQAKATLRRLFADWTPQIREVIERTPDETIFRTDIADRPPVTVWGEARVTLLGDAAHPMTPNLGQGACQAIEDALVIGLELEKAGELAPALRSYEAIRQPRANATVKLARRLGAMAQWSNPVARWMRDTTFSMIPLSLTRKRLMAGWKLPY